MAPNFTSCMDVWAAAGRGVSEKVSAVGFCLGSAQCCVLTNSSPLGVGQAPVENSWGTYISKNVAQKKLA